MASSSTPVFLARAAGQVRHLLGRHVGRAASRLDDLCRQVADLPGLVSRLVEGFEALDQAGTEQGTRSQLHSPGHRRAELRRLIAGVLRCVADVLERTRGAISREEVED
jgi:hypothetical protein